VLLATGKVLVKRCDAAIAEAPMKTQRALGLAL
jgi:hypothetical protein